MCLSTLCCCTWQGPSKICAFRSGTGKIWPRGCMQPVRQLHPACVHLPINCARPSLHALLPPWCTEGPDLLDFPSLQQLLLLLVSLLQDLLRAAGRKVRAGGAVAGAGGGAAAGAGRSAEPMPRGAVRAWRSGGQGMGGEEGGGTTHSLPPMVHSPHRYQQQQQVRTPVALLLGDYTWWQEAPSGQPTSITQASPQRICSPRHSRTTRSPARWSWLSSHYMQLSGPLPEVAGSPPPCLHGSMQGFPLVA